MNPKGKSTSLGHTHPNVLHLIVRQAGSAALMTGDGCRVEAVVVVVGGGEG